MSQGQRDFYKEKYGTLADLPGVGPATIKSLSEMGYKTVEAVATATPEELVAGGIGEDTANKIITAARKSIAIEFVTGTELYELRKDVKSMTTGSKGLDNLFHQFNRPRGGLPTQSITEFYGEFGSGKSQLCQQLVCTVQLSEEQGGLDGACLYIDTEQTFTPERIMQICPRFGLTPEEALSKIIYASAYTSSHQELLLENADEVIKKNNVRLIIIDSLTSHYRSEYLGREMLAPRQQALNKHLHKLIRLAQAFNAVAVITNQAIATPTQWASSSDPGAIGGHIVGHRAHSRCYLKKGRANLRIARIVASPFLAIGETPINITDLGFMSKEDYPEEEE